ncbi:MAG: carboxypeptidase regulatory-like domain-containing protein [Acidobacteriota bacterium]
MFLLSWGLCSLFAQSERATITGAVHDTSGAVVPAAKVTVTNALTNVTTQATTNGSGDYSVPSLQPGTYSVRVEKDGFRPSLESNLVLDAAQTVRADATLQVGNSTQTVEVQASAVQLQTEDARSAITLQNRLVNDLPLVAGGTVRSPFDLAALAPDAKNLGGDNGFSLGGGQAAGYGTSLDGVSTNTSRALSKSWVSSNSPSVEAIDQFTVETNGYKAESGHASGGNMTFASKGGTNAFHGSAYEFLRNNDFDANNFFNNAAGLPVGIYKQNDFGFTAGGPVWIPKLYRGKDKTFFFFSYEGFRNRNGATGAGFTVPTPEMYAGDFSKWVTNTGTQIPIFNPLTQTQNADGTWTRQQFAGNVIPKSLFSPQSMKALGVFQSGGALTPNTNAAPGTFAYINNNYLVNNGTSVNPVNKWSIKGDHIFNEKHRISGYYGNDRELTTPGPDGPPTLPGLYSNYNDLSQLSDVLRFSWDWTFSSNKLNHFYAGGNNWRQDHKSVQQYAGKWKDKFCMVNVPNCDENLVNLNGSLMGWGGVADNGSENTVYSYNDDFTWIRNKHTFKFGGQFQVNHYNGFGRQCEAGCVSFSSNETGNPNSITNSSTGGNAFASFLLGQADGGSLDTVRFIGQQFPYFAGYFQDDWRLTPKLVLNIGLRWDATLPYTGLDDRWSDFSPTTLNPDTGTLGAVLFAGSGAGRVGSRTLGDFWAKGFGPHVGFAYSRDAKTVIRASYARSYGALVSVSGSTHNMGFTNSPSFSSPDQGLHPAFTMDAGFPAWVNPPFINPAVSNGQSPSWFQGVEATKPPAAENFSFSIQRQIRGSMVAEVVYNGVMGSHLQTQLLNLNQTPSKYLTAFGTIAQSSAVLNSRIGSALANQWGITAPFPGFSALWTNGRDTVKQALKPFPQYSGIDTYNGEGDHSGHSTYHSVQVRFQKRYSAGLTMQSSYSFSKLLTDSDSYWGSGGAADFYNRGLEKSIGAYDVTHDFKLSGVYDLPFGKGQKFLKSGPASWIAGNWRMAGVVVYDVGTPVGLSTNYSLNIISARPYVTSFDGWRPASWKNGKFDPAVDTTLVPWCSSATVTCNGPFPFQGTGSSLLGEGNMTRFNPKLRQFPNLNENISVTRSFPIHEQIRMEFRAEAFNVFNRVRFGQGSTQLQSQNFGRLTVSAGNQANAPRQLQLALKLYF